MSDEFVQSVNHERYQDLLEEEPGAMAVHALRVVSYINVDGERRFKWQFEGKQSRSEVIGDLQRICHDLMENDENLR